MHFGNFPATDTKTDFAASMEEALADLRLQLLGHPLYEAVDSLQRVRIFMEEHVFAVWDFMSLLKRLQQAVTCVSVPWIPTADPQIARFINEIVLGEECDEDGEGGYASHFQLYCSAMSELGADTGKMERFLLELGRGQSPETILANLEVRPETREFVLQNLMLAASGTPHEVAAVFCHGREDVIPHMFMRLVPGIERQGQSAERLAYYLRRHIELDGDHHAPLANRLLQQLAGDAPENWQAATIAARSALQNRIRLWDGILARIQAEAT